MSSGGSQAQPTIIYGTAWKEAATEGLVAAALEAGYRAIDTANQRKHYYEEGVGKALRAAFASGRVRRDELFLQTKFTFRDGQDHRLPYDPAAPVAKQVQQSMKSSLDHLGVDHLDSYVLHGPSRYNGLGPDDWEAWGAMEDEQRAGRTRAIGVSNISAAQLEELYARAAVKPAFVQNRTFTRPKADGAVREFCGKNGILYEGFSLLTASTSLLRHPNFVRIANDARCTPAQVMFRCAIRANIVPLTGTTSRVHMAEDLAARDLPLSDADLEALSPLFG